MLANVRLFLGKMGHEELNRGKSVKDTPWFKKHHCFDNTRKDITFHIHKKTPTLWQDLFELWYSFCNKTRRLWPQAIQFVKVHTKPRCCWIWMKSFLWLRWKQNNWYERVFFSVKFILACNIIASYTFYLIEYHILTWWLSSLLREARQKSVVNNKTW